MKYNEAGVLLSKIFIVTGMATALLTPAYVKAQINYSPQEIALLPEYCKYTQDYRTRGIGGDDPQKIKQWYAIFGGSPGEGLFHAMHHYCYGLTDVNYAKLWVRSQQERQAYLQNSINEFNYVIGHSRPDEKMLPEFHTKKGESLLALGRAPLAIAEFERAISLKPDYWPPYAAISDYYKETGNTKLARELLERGLASSPDARALTRRLTELDASKGKPSTSSQPPRKTVTAKAPPKENAPPDPQQSEALQSPQVK